MKDLDKYNEIFHEELQILQFQETASVAEKHNEKLSEVLGYADGLQFAAGHILAEQRRQWDTLGELVNAFMQQSLRDDAREKITYSALKDIQVNMNQNHESLGAMTDGETC
jgi:hypothetical protein